jgi:hypothetical protein
MPDSSRHARDVRLAQDLLRLAASDRLAIDFPPWQHPGLYLSAEQFSAFKKERKRRRLARLIRRILREARGDGLLAQ